MHMYVTNKYQALGTTKHSPCLTKITPRAKIPAKVRFVTHKKLVAMGKVLIFLSNASQKLGMREIGGDMERERRITVSRMATLLRF